MGQLRRVEAGLFDRATAAAIEDCDALRTGRLAATGIDVHQQLADFAAGGRGGHHKESEGHPRQSLAVATHRGETALAAVQFLHSASGVVVSLSCLLVTTNSLPWQATPSGPGDPLLP